MCGFVGYFSQNSQVDALAIVQKMLPTISHRGPDDEGVYRLGKLALGFRRLAILDISQSGHQPMFFSNHVMVFNGEIYNYQELRGELKLLGHKFVSDTDSEVLLHAFVEWGRDAFNRLRGMWACAILDEGSNRLILSRDRFGIKPLFLSDSVQGLSFASEIQALIEAGASREADREVLASYLVTATHDLCRKTFFKSIRQLPPGTNLELDLKSGEIDEYQYYSFGEGLLAQGPVSSADWKDAFKESIRIHLRSDVAVGTCLSGGLDSSAVAALAADELNFHGQTLCAVTAKSEQLCNDESSYAQIVVEAKKLDWVTTKPSYEDFRSHIEECLYRQGEPCGGPSVFMQYMVMKRAKESGLKVMLDGQGGDEALLGYERYYARYFLDLIKRCRFRYFVSEWRNASRRSKLNLASLLLHSIYFSSIRVRKYVLLSRVRFLKREIRRLGVGFIEKSRRFSSVFEMQRLEISENQMPLLLRYEDRNSMAHSVEARVPFVDHICIEKALNLDLEDKIRDGYTKFVLRTLISEILPPNIAWRTHKVGFEAPERIWLDRHRTAMEDEIRASDFVAGICDYMPDLHKLPLRVQWRLYNVAVWSRQFSVY